MVYLLFYFYVGYLTTLSLYRLYSVGWEEEWWRWRSWWNENWQGKQKYSEKTSRSATLFTISTWPDLGSKPDRRCWKPTATLLSSETTACLLLCSVLL
jgi:hypothetical protein